MTKVFFIFFWWGELVFLEISFHSNQCCYIHQLSFALTKLLHIYFSDGEKDLKNYRYVGVITKSMQNKYDTA